MPTSLPVAVADPLKLGRPQVLRAIPSQTIMDLPPSAFSPQIRDIQDSIDSDEQRFQGLMQQVQELSESIVRRRWIISPIRRIPVEILIPIFESALTLDTGKTRDIRTVVGHHRTLLSLLLVCKEWSDIVIGTPRCWHQLCIHLPKHCPNDRHILERHLSRSASGPNVLHIHIRVSTF